MIKKDGQIKWNEENMFSFDNIKEAIPHDPILVIPNQTFPLIYLPMLPKT